jgi:regulator of extracellular matrix RemA (YlzA/DUF370 family)
MMISVGYENFVNSSLMVAILKPDSSPLKKLRHKAENERMLINATSGRKARSLIVMKSNHIILSALQTETLKQRLNVTKPKERLG